MHFSGRSTPLRTTMTGADGFQFTTIIFLICFRDTNDEIGFARNLGFHVLDFGTESCSATPGQRRKIEGSHV